MANDYAEPKTLHRWLDGKPDTTEVKNEAEEKSAKMKGFADELPPKK